MIKDQKYLHCPPYCEHDFKAGRPCRHADFTTAHSALINLLSSKASITVAWLTDQNTAGLIGKTDQYTSLTKGLKNLFIKD